MSPEEPRRYLPADPAAPRGDESVRETLASQYDAWDRGEDADDDRLSPPPARSRSIFAFLEVPYARRPRFPDSAAWAAAYFAAAFVACAFFWICAQLVPALITVVGMLVWNCVTLGVNQALSGPAMQQLQDESIAPMLIAGHVAAVSLSVLLLRVVLGPDWARRAAMHLSGFPDLLETLLLRQWRKLPATAAGAGGWHLFLTLLLVPALLLLSTGVFGLAKKVFPNLGELTGLPMPGMEKMVQLFGRWPWWLAVLVVGLGPALGEELWCRGFMGLGLFGRNGGVARVLVTSFYFGLLHVDPQQGTMAAVMGLALHFVLLTTRCFWMPVVIHFCINSTSVLAARFESASAIDQRPEDFPLVLYAGAFALFAAVACSLYRTRARLSSADASPVRVLWEPTYAGLEHPPPDSGVVVTRPPPDVIDWALIALGVGTFSCSIAWAVVFA